MNEEQITDNLTDNLTENLTDNLTDNLTNNLTENLTPDPDTLDYSVGLTSINDSIDLNNSIMAGQLFFFGIICGLIFMYIFWSRFR